MKDIQDEEIVRLKRSYNMSQTKSKNTKPEILVRKLLFSKGFRFRIHYSKLPGKPDIVLPKYKTVIFVNGCFWHGHDNCKYFVIPKTRSEWWAEKINKNKNRDFQNYEKIRNLGWQIIEIFGDFIQSPIRALITGMTLIEVRGRLKSPLTVGPCPSLP